MKTKKLGIKSKTNTKSKTKLITSGSKLKGIAITIQDLTKVKLKEVW